MITCVRAPAFGTYIGLHNESSRFVQHDMSVSRAPPSEDQFVHVLLAAQILFRDRPEPPLRVAGCIHNVFQVFARRLEPTVDDLTAAYAYRIHICPYVHKHV